MRTGADQTSTVIRYQHVCKLLAQAEGDILQLRRQNDELRQQLHEKMLEDESKKP